MNQIEKLWWFAELERGVEVADINREPLIGSEDVLATIANISTKDNVHRVPLGWDRRK